MSDGLRMPGPRRVRPQDVPDRAGDDGPQVPVHGVRVRVSYPSESAAFARAEALRARGIWPGVRRVGPLAWEVTCDPWEGRHLK